MLRKKVGAFKRCNAMQRSQCVLVWSDAQIDELRDSLPVKRRRAEQPFPQLSYIMGAHRPCCFSFADPVGSDNKEGKDDWIRDLAGGVPLKQLAAKVPRYKVSSLFEVLAKEDVPIVRAAWYACCCDVALLRLLAVCLGSIVHLTSMVCCAAQDHSHLLSEHDAEIGVFARHACVAEANSVHLATRLAVALPAPLRAAKRSLRTSAKSCRICSACCFRLVRRRLFPPRHRPQRRPPRRRRESPLVPLLPLVEVQGLLGRPPQAQVHSVPLPCRCANGTI